jgi:hypothetical protein
MLQCSKYKARQAKSVQNRPLPKIPAFPVHPYDKKSEQSKGVLAFWQNDSCSTFRYNHGYNGTTNWNKRGSGALPK